MTDISYLRKMINGVPVVTAPAEIDITTADQLRAVLLDTTARGHAAVVVDMTRTRFCDCCGQHACCARTSRPGQTAASCGWSSPPTAPFSASWP